MFRASIRWAGWLSCALALVSCAQPALTTPTEEVMSTAESPTPDPTTPPPTETPIPIQRSLIPIPAEISWDQGTFTIIEQTVIYVQPASEELMAVGQYLADKINSASGYQLIVESLDGTVPEGSILLTTAGGDTALGEEGYSLLVKPEGVTLTASQPAGVFYGVQTIRQLLPAAIESDAPQSEQWVMPAVTIHDTPRYAWRGMMLDVARHFFSVEDVKQVIEYAAYAKLNRFHLHLTDDQGWRIEIKSWPNLTAHGSTSAVNGDPGGFYTQEDYAEIVAFAQARYITIIPEIDMPGHTNAALASYPELNCNDTAPDLYTGIEVGFSSFCIEKEITYTFIDDVIRELAAMTPGAYIHIGGDEAKATPKPDYITFVERVEEIVRAQGKQIIGWEEITQTELDRSSVVQYWTDPEKAQAAAQQGVSIIISPASRAYLDMKYDETSPLGLFWAGLISVEHGYSWDPATHASGIPENLILGVESPLWAETIVTLDDLEYLAFPRLLGYAEIGWSPQSARDWSEYRMRLGAHGSRLRHMKINFFAAPDVPWE